ncbi:hypothetical protein EIP91_009934 [Steccherinum ochraceum]|uniref:SET domain-containing protein n=1 Tax=Steccherinum ochraceum TaxID=92696 RepID=A0A4R0R3C5_9APHY|nr:hypothetical protein EIP91_009934 [Steccherinum ochraceum]
MAASLPDVTDLARLVGAMGFGPEQLQQAMTDPSFRRLVSQIPAFSDLSSSTYEDILDDAFDQEFSQTLRMIEQAKAAHLREQSLPPVKSPQVPRSALLAGFTRSSGPASATKDTVVTMQWRQTYIGVVPGYSTKTLDELERIDINNMLVRKRHEGAYIMCRIISQTRHIVSVEMIVEDPLGATCLLSIYRYPTALDCTVEQADMMFPIGTILAVREPYYKFPSNGEVPLIRVDAPSDLVFLDRHPVLLNGVTWPTPGPLRSIGPADNAVTWKDRGNRYFKRKEWICAASAFSEGLLQDPTDHRLLLNRAAVYIELGWLRSAAHDAERVIAMDLEDAQLLRKAVYRAAKAYYLSGRYDDVRRLSSLGLQCPEVQQLCRNADRRLRERNSGQYDWATIYGATRAAASRPDVAAYRGPVAVQIPKGGVRPRGLFVTRAVKAGELLIVSKPIASYFPEDTPSKQDELFRSINLLNDTMNNRSHYVLIDLVVQRMWDDPDLASVIQAMYAGESFPAANGYPIAPAAPSFVGPLSHSRTPCIDIDVGRVEGVCSINAFGVGDIDFTDAASEQQEYPNLDKPTGLYELPSFCNHACLPSADRTFFGDVMAIRATRDLKAGEEVTMTYCDSAQTYQKRTEFVQKKWRFACDCLLCKADLSDSPAARSRRAEAVDMPSSLGISAIKQRIAQIKSTYTDSPERRRCGIKPELFHAYHRLGFVYSKESHVTHRLARAKVELCIIAFMDALEAVGLVITDRSVSGPVKGPSSALPVDMIRVPSLSHLCTPTVIQIASALSGALDQDVRARNWIKVAIWIENTSTGGGEALFEQKYRSFLNT